MRRSLSPSDVQVGQTIELDQPAGLQNKELAYKQRSSLGKVGKPPHSEQKSAPKFGVAHAWGMVKWGAKAGAWGQGSESLDQRRRDK